MATINPLLIFKNLNRTEQAWRGEVMEIDTALQQARVKRGATHSYWLANSLTLAVGDYVIAKDKAVVSKLPATVDYQSITL